MTHDTEHSRDMEALVPEAIALAQEWLEATGKDESGKEAKATAQLGALVQSTQGVEFTMGFVDKVARPADNTVAASELAQLAQGSSIPDFVGPVDKGLVKLGALVAPKLPHVVMPLARTRLRQMVGHLVLDAEGKALNRLLDRSREQGFRLNLNLLGEAVLGEEEAKRRIQRTVDLLNNERVNYVSIKASSVCAQLNPWDVEGSIERLKERLRPLYRAAVQRTLDPAFLPEDTVTTSAHPFINMDMEEYKDLNLTIELFEQLLMEDEFLELEAGIVLQAYLPDTFDALQRLAEFAKRRVAAGGAPIKIRLVKGANLSMERVEAELHDWKQAPYYSKGEVDANYMRLLDYILREEFADVVRIGVASHNLYSVAMATVLAEKRGVMRQLDVEMLQGMAPSQARAVRARVGSLILYTPVVHAEDFDVAVSYLVRRLEENGAKENFLHSLFAPEIVGEEGLTPIQEQERAFERAVATRWDTFAGPNRTQDRNQEEGAQGEGSPGNFVGEPDTDPALPQNREWAKHWLAQEPPALDYPLITDPAVIDAAVQTATEQAKAWSVFDGHTRARVLDRIAEELADRRGALVNIAAHEAGKTVDQSDPEISEAIDFARYYAESARALDNTPGLSFSPYPVALITPPWNFPVAIPVGGVLASLAAGSAVIIKPAPQVVRCAQVVMECVHAGIQKVLDAGEIEGVSTDLVQLLNTDEAEAGKALVSHDGVDSVILTGASDTAKLFRSWKKDMVINAETSGKNAIIVTPAADPDLAVADLYKSAFGHSGQKCSAASLAILVGSVGSSERFLGQLVDAVSTLVPGHGTDISTTMNGLIEAPGEKLLRGLTQLDEGESWLLEPKKLNEEGTLWSPGIRVGVKPGSWFHKNECFGPVLGIMVAKDLKEAISWQNSTGYGLTGGLHSLDPAEIEYWREHVEVGNAYINRGITGAIVERQSFGGWKNSSIGTGAKAGGPNYVPQLGTWADADLNTLPTSTITPPVTRALRQLANTGLFSEEDLAWLRTAAGSDAYAWATEFGQEHDRTGLACESNVFRYRRLLDPLLVRFDGSLRDLARLGLGSLVTGSKLEVHALPGQEESLGDLAQILGFALYDSTEEEFAKVVASSPHARIRVLGEVSTQLRDAAVEANAVILDGPVLAAGRRELLAQLLEQAVSQTLHRFGYIKKTQ